MTARKLAHVRLRLDKLCRWSVQTREIIMDKCACFISLLFFALPLQAQEMEQLGWLAGNWVHQQAGEEVQETWLGPRHGVMVGINLTSAEGPRTNFELMRIARKDERIVYFASP